MRQREDRVNRAWGVGAPASCHTQRRTGMGEDGEQKPEGGWVGPDAAEHSSRTARRLAAVHRGRNLGGMRPLEKDKGLPVTRQATWPSAGKERGK